MFLPITMANAESPQNWPRKPVRLVVAAPAGSSVDIVARVIADGLKERWPNGLIVDNKPAAGGTTSAAEVARSAPDGYTLLLGYNGPLATAPALYPKLAYDPFKDFVPVILAGSQPNLLAVNASLPASNLSELVALMRANPGKLNYASVGNGSASHLCMELMKRTLGVDVVHVPFNGGPPATQAVIVGDVQMIFAAPSNLMGQVRAGKLKAIAITGRSRFAPVADIPTAAESGIPALANFEALAWNGIVAPSATDPAIVAAINREVNAVLARSETRKKLFDAGIEAGGGSAESFGRLMKSESEKWSAVIRATGARID
jgi:tripartite-type tricarboxylate transporter receptor subunit TctC